MSTTTALPLTTGTWAADVAHSNVGFVARHLGLSKVRGSFETFTASVEVGTDLSDTTVRAEIDLSSVSTGNADRDGHLKSSDFFNAETNPTMTFVSTSITGSGESYTLVGDLTINGVTKPVELDVEFFGTETAPMDQSVRAGFNATGSLSRKDYGIEWNVALGGDKVLVSDKINLDLDIQLIAP
jgi:polyisoprenoid-binding protein YceI